MSTRFVVIGTESKPLPAHVAFAHRTVKVTNLTTGAVVLDTTTPDKSISVNVEPGVQYALAVQDFGSDGNPLGAPVTGTGSVSPDATFDAVVSVTLALSPV